MDRSSTSLPRIQAIRVVPLDRHKIQSPDEQGRRTFSACGVMQQVLVKSPPKCPVLWVQKDDTQGNKVYLCVGWWVAWEKNMDCFLSPKVFCLLPMEKIELYSNKVAAIAEGFVLGES